MGKPAYGIIKLLRLLSVLVVLATLLTLFVYSPYYSQSILWMLNQWVPVKVDPIAAKSQQSGQLTLDDALEPGSKEWVAQRAYQYEVNQTLKNGDIEQFVDLQLRYQNLLTLISEEKSQQTNTKPETVIRLVPSSDATDLQTPLPQPVLLLDENEPLLQQYREFLRQDQQSIDLQLDAKTIEQIQSYSAPLIFKRPADQPHAIVILGGGLMAGDTKGEIVVNRYTQKRLETAVEIYQHNPLPILLSGVEAPYMQKWLAQYDIKAQFLENRSMNTCENTRFTALMLQKQGGAPTVYLITDAYHMPRSQRLFATNGIAAVPVNAALPNALTPWQPSSVNLMHSRRATYEVLATLRDLWFGESNCREIP